MQYVHMYMSELQLFGTIEILAVFGQYRLFFSTDLNNFFTCYSSLNVPLPHQISAL